MDFSSYINGQFVNPQSQTLQKICPFTGELLGWVHSADVMQLIPAVTASKKALTEMRETTLDTRAKWIKKICEYLETRGEDMALGEALHQGLGFQFMRDEVLKGSQEVLRDLVADLQQDHPLQMGAGVVTVILPWTLSLKFALEKLGKALAAGCPSLIKISPLSPITGHYLAEIVKHAEIPESYVQIIQGGKEVAQFLSSHPAVMGVVAHCSQPTLEDLVREGSRTQKKLQLSGGVKNSAFVLSDFDLENNFDQIMLPFMRGQGQLCFNTTRLFILEKQVELFKALAEDYFSKITPSQGPKDPSLWTPLIHAEAVDRSLHKIRAGAGERGQVFIGGEKLEAQGSFLSPALMLDLTNCSELQQDDLQAPLLLVGAVKYQHEMAKWANNTYLAHSAVIWGGAEKAPKVARQIEAELIQVNQWRIPKEPVFGFKNTSYGNGDSLWNGRFYSHVKRMTLE